jgi:hypothetical protein
MPTHVMVQTARGAQVLVTATSAADRIVATPALNADADGRANLTITAPAAGEKVALQVQATKAGAVARCAASFTPVELPQATDSPGLPPIQITTQPRPPAGADT